MKPVWPATLVEYAKAIMEGNFRDEFPLDGMGPKGSERWLAFKTAGDQLMTSMPETDKRAFSLFLVLHGLRTPLAVLEFEADSHKYQDLAGRSPDHR